VELEVRGRSSGINVSANDLGVSVQGYNEMPDGGVIYGYNPASGPYVQGVFFGAGGLIFSADEDEVNVGGQFQWLQGTLMGIFGSQGGSVGGRLPVNFGGWSGTGIFTIQTGSGLPLGPGWRDPIPGQPVNSPDASGVYFQIELTR
jgi:hypothetical protein